MIKEYAPFLKEFDCDPGFTTISFRDQNRPFFLNGHAGSMNKKLFA